MEVFTVATTKQLEIDAPRNMVWRRINDIKNYHRYFSTVYMIELLSNQESTSKSVSVGSKCKITRLLKSGHCFQATYTVIRKDEENMEIQFYSEDLGGVGNSTVSTTWIVSPSDDPFKCNLTMSIAIVPHKLLICTVGKLVFTPLIKRLVRKTIKQDLKDFAAVMSTSSYHSSQAQFLEVRGDDTLEKSMRIESPDDIHTLLSETSGGYTATTDDNITSSSI